MIDVRPSSDPALSLIAAGVAGTALLVVCGFLVLRDSLRKNSLVKSAISAAASMFWTKPEAKDYQQVPQNNSDDEVDLEAEKPIGAKKNHG